MEPTNPQALHHSNGWNYQKIWMDEELTVSSDTQTFTIAHNLGYQPNVRVFFESMPGEVWPAHYGGAADFYLYDFSNQGECRAYVTTTNLVIDYTAPAGKGVGKKIWYRIYLDD